MSDKCIFCLTPEQEKIMKPLFDELNAAVASDQRCDIRYKGRVIIAQVFQGFEGSAWATCKVLDSPTSYRLWFALKALEQNELDEAAKAKV